MTLRSFILFFCLVVMPGFGLAQDKAAVERKFLAWLEQEIWPQARRKGVSRATFDAALGDVTLNWKLPELVPPGSSGTPKKQRQAEFGTPSRYFSRSQMDGATSVGKVMAKRHAKALQAAEQRTGVPGRIILAIWGRESGYGRVAIRYDAFRVLATKGFMSTRPDLFTTELIAALQIAEKGLAPGKSLKSSWAGALGQPQFLPSKYLQFGRDGDGDKRADIWGSEADTIASIAAYLKHFGWVPGRDWGFEVKVPNCVSCILEGPDQGRSIADWAKMGITRVSGRPFPEHELKGQGFLVMPAGRKGPAFVVTPNFYVLKDYNESDLYALFVGHVGDRIQYNMRDFRGSWRKIGKLSRADVVVMQRALEKMGHDVGGADGLAGYKTRRSIGRWQESRGKQATCFPEVGMKKRLKP